MNEIFRYFWRYFVCKYAGPNHLGTEHIFKIKRGRSLARELREPMNDHVLFWNDKMIGSRIVTDKKSSKYRKISFIYGLVKLYFDKKSCRQVSKIILVYICVVFKAGFVLFLINYGVYFVCVFQTVKRLANLSNYYI